MVNDPSTDDLIHWSEDGSTFIGKDYKIFLFNLL